MLATFKHIEFISKSGNTELIYIVHNRRKSPFEVLADKWNGLSDRKKYLIQQKSLGVALVVIGIVAMMMFPEDAYGGFVVSGMGLLRVVFND